MADDFKNTNEKDLAKTFLGHADQLARQVMTSQPIGRTWPIAFGRLALLYHELGENDAAITAANTAHSAFQDALNAGDDNITPMDLACVSALLAEIFSGQNLSKKWNSLTNPSSLFRFRPIWLQDIFMNCWGHG